MLDVNRDDYRRGAAAKYCEVLTACSGPKVNERDAAVKALQPGDLKPGTPEAADRVRNLVAKWSLPQKPLSAPLSVVYGGLDTFIDAASTDALKVVLQAAAVESQDDRRVVAGAVA